MKVCTNCKISKPFDEFYKKAAMGGGGRRSVCKDCCKVKNKEYYSDDAHKINIRKTDSEARLVRRQFLYDYYKSHKCVDCGESDPVVLELDHVYGNKIASIGTMVNSGGFSLDKIKEEIQKCEVRCANCHRRKTAISQNWYKNLI